MKYQKQHILIALHRFAIGGAETQALYLAEFLKQEGYQVTIGAFGDEIGEGYFRFNRLGHKTIHWGFQEKLILTPTQNLSGLLRRYYYSRKLILQVKRLGIDSIIPFTYPANSIFCQWFKRMGAKKCFWNQRDEGRFFKGDSFDIKCLNNATSIISNSLEGSNFLQRFTKRNIKIIHNGVMPVDESSSKSDYESKIRVVKIGNLHSYKDHFTLLKAWKIVIERFGKEEVQLLLAGNKLDEYSSLSTFVSENKMESTVSFLGEVKDINSLLLSAQLAVFSSYNEGIPNGVLEPMAAGLAVIATNCLGAQEALGVDYPFLVTPKDHESLAIKIIELIENRSLSDGIGRQNKKRIADSFSMARMCNQYLELIESQ
ncbi:glycosyltransferase family 4 protein [Algoriphagus halophilus]|uniref:Glycosyltransferase involved in cell wall bisynthesis n=1 Tax=Algoriphagus halophilus TaxID=226505 RepID=A0A1N6ECU0_9BACT|nr:glycosyltransferase family 4 protein [Algoriphagus halophilus]SIN80855.1 Glycosyltransferase involved in cell wall bisynthesis [Algoriphagus halophilus]